ncbi:serine hydrolase domain-containing protein [Streptomyces sp. NPDC090025]|uniref:serine hydrolase domain-containing protein n=1 Tax=Streptomyces sp. NPDC090025 TaxID=3365922 RepID=UPI003833DECE
MRLPRTAGPDRKDGLDGPARRDDLTGPARRDDLTGPARPGRSASARTTAVATTALFALSLGVLPAQAATARPGAATSATTSSADRQHRPGLDRAALRGSLDAFRDAGMYGAYSAVRDGSQRWRGATGVADPATGRPMAPGFEHRIGSITKTFTAVAVLKEVERGRIDLDAPVGRYLPDLVDGERGAKVTVRMLLNHTSGIPDYIVPAFPGILQDPGKALDAQRFRRVDPRELARLGLAAPPVVERGTWSYSNTNYVLAGLILERVTGENAERYITRQVIRKAGLRHTYFPSTAAVKGPHAGMYESFYGYIDPPRDYSTYDMSWAGTAGAMVSTMDDLNTFYRALLGGKLLSPASLRAMKTTVPTAEPVPGVPESMRYGLGLYTLRMPSGNWAWGHDGGVFGAGTWSLASEDGRRQVSIGYNLMKYQRFDEASGQWLPDPITEALVAHVDGALAGAAKAPAPAAPSAPAARGTAPARATVPQPLDARVPGFRP